MDKVVDLKRDSKRRVAVPSRAPNPTNRTVRRHDLAASVTKTHDGEESSPAAHFDASSVALAKAVIRARQNRDQLFPQTVFGEPTWDLLLDLYVAAAENRKVSIKSACIASNVSRTTASRCLGKMIECGLLVRFDDQFDGRSSYVVLGEQATVALEKWLVNYSRAIGTARNLEGC